MTTMIAINIAIWLLMLFLLAFTKYNYGPIALLIVLLLAITGCVTPNEALAEFANLNVINLAAMMMIIAAFNKTSAIQNIGDLLFKASGGSFERCCAALMIILSLIGLVLGAAFTRLAIVYPIVLGICERFHKNPSKAMFPIACLLLCDQTAIPIGGGAITFVKYNGFLETAGYTYGDKFAMLDPFLARLPICIIMVLYFVFFGLKMAPDEPAVKLQTLSFKEKEKVYMKPRQEMITYLVFAGNAIMLALAGSLGIDQWLITCSSAAILYFTGCLSLKEGEAALPHSLMWLLVGAFTMSKALVNTGTGAFVGKLIANLLGGHPNTIVLYLTFWLVTVFLTQFMNNGATANLLMPIGILTAEAIGCSAKGIMIAIQNASLVAWFMPTATMIIPMVMEGGGYDLKQMFKQGLPPAIIKTVTMIIWISILFPAYK